MSAKTITTNFSIVAAIALLTAVPALADPFLFSTGDPDGKIAVGSRPDSAGKFEIEAADDFVLQQPTILTNASFTGLIPVGSLVLNVVVEIYRVFPDDSNVGRTSGSPTFSTPQVPTRVNSPSDVAFTSRDGAGGDLTFATTALSGSFTALNSVQPGGIHPRPNQTTGGNGALSGEEVRLDVNFSVDVSLAADHYFFVPQVQLNTGDFYWLSAPKPIVAPGTPFPGGATDLQSWTRDESLDPDWLRVGTDIVGVGAFNQAFSLTGTTDATSIPEPGTLTLFGAGLAGFLAFRRRHRPKA